MDINTQSTELTTNPKNGKAIKLPECLNSAQVAMLTQKSPANLIRTRKGSGGKDLKYLPHNFVTEMLNQAFGFGWSFHTEVIQITDKECIVKGKITIHNKTQELVKEQYGSQLILKGMAIGDALKGAGSDALRKCASLIGIGLDLYGEEHYEEPAPTQRQQPPARTANEWELKKLKSQITGQCRRYGVNQEEFEIRFVEWINRKFGKPTSELLTTELEEVMFVTETLVTKLWVETKPEEYEAFVKQKQQAAKEESERKAAEFEERNKYKDD